MIIVFNPAMAAALLAGRKLVTRRDWKQAHAASVTRRYDEDMPFAAYSGNPRNGGRRIGSLALTQRPVIRSTATMGNGEYEAEGFAWIDEDAQRRDLYLPSMARQLELPEQPTMLALFEHWRERGGNMWVVRFELIREEA